LVADQLLEVGLADLASAALQPVAAAAAGAPQATRVAVARRLLEVGDVTAARKLARTRCSPVPSDPQLREICLPRPHADVVAEALEGSGLDPFLPYAIMTAESALQPGVTSLAGARGLMQLMPEVGQRLHEQRFPDRRYDADHLYRGAYNAALGTSELRRLYERYQAQGIEQALPLAAAGYNGGQDAVDRWLAAVDGELEMDAFAENIGYTETRRYVKKVLGYLMKYRQGYGVE